jgi:hypothetical protein
MKKLIKTLIINCRERRLREPIEYKCRVESGRHWHWLVFIDEPYYLYGEGETEEEAVEDLKMDMAHDYNFWTNIDDKDLTETTIKLKRKYLNLFEED